MLPAIRSVQRLRTRPLVVDGLLAGGLILLSVPGLWVTTSYLAIDTREPDVLGVLLTIAACVPVAWRRRRPMPAFFAAAVPSVVLGGLGYVQNLGGVPVLVALYSVAAYSPRRLSVAALALSMVLTVVVLAVDPFPQGPADYLGTAAVFAAGWAFGRSLRHRRAYVAELEARANQLQATRDADTRAALAEERSRIARELHDVVAHHVSVMTVQAAAASRTLARDPDCAATAMAAVEQTGRAALVEMRRIVGVLRTGPDRPHGELAPQPGMADLQTLLDQVREAGLDVRLEVVGAARPLDTGVDLAVFRVVQEALTNTLQHAGPSRALVTLTFEAGAVGVSVVDTGRGAAAGLQASPDHLGHGLLGMRERVGAYGGRLHAGPRAGGGFEVSASFPVEQVSA